MSDKELGQAHVSEVGEVIVNASGHVDVLERQYGRVLQFIFPRASFDASDSRLLATCATALAIDNGEWILPVSARSRGVRRSFVG